MPVATLPGRPTPRNAPLRARAIAKLIADSTSPTAVHGRSDSGGDRCHQCNRNPRAKKLFEIVVGADTVRVGVGTCHRRHLATAINDAIREETSGNRPDRPERIKRLNTVLEELK